MRPFINRPQVSFIDFLKGPVYNNGNTLKNREQ